MKKIVLSLSAIFLIVGYTSAQFNAQVYGSFIRNLNKDFSGSTTGVGLRIEYSKAESSVGYFAGFAHAFSITTKHELEARAYSNFTEPSTVDVTALYKLPMNRAEAGLRYYISGDAHNKESINFFMDIKAEVIFFKNIPKYSYYNTEDYTLGVLSDEENNEDGSAKKFLDVYAGLGFGIEKNLGPGNLFLRAGISLPLMKTEADGTQSDVAEVAPIPLNFDFGYKIFLFRSDK